MNNKLAKLNYEYCEKARVLKDNIENGFLELARRLHKIKEERRFEPEFDDYYMFLDDIGVDPATDSKLRNIYKKLVLEYKINPILIAKARWSNISEALPVIDGEESAKEWLQKATILSRVDLRREIKEKKTGIVMSECKHKDYYLVKVCRDCGERERHYESKE